MLPTEGMFLKFPLKGTESEALSIFFRFTVINVTISDLNTDPDIEMECLPESGFRHSTFTKPGPVLVHHRSQISRT